MSLTINPNKLKFVIFGSGHDYTLADSGKGEVQFFSHPFMAKGARAYAGMYYFLVPDEDGNPMDAVKNDIAHCTFTPALGDTFDTAGETEVEVVYRREYIYDEETLLVEKHLKQKITVVDHGAVQTSYFNNIIYADGYCYVNPGSDYVSRSNGWWLSGSFKKISSLPWGSVSISNISTNLEDASEMGFADVSGFNSFKDLFQGCSKLTNIHGFENWNISNVRKLTNMFGGCSALEDITPLKKWDTSHVTDFTSMFWNTGIKNTDGLQNFKFTSAYSLSKFFDSCNALVDLEGISGWDLKPISDITYMFNRCLSLKNLKPLKNWDVSNVYNMDYAFGGYASNEKSTKLESLDGLEGWDVSNVRTFTHMFTIQFWLTDISAVESWNVSNGITFDYMFSRYSGSDLEALRNWNMSNATTVMNMFNNGGKIWSEAMDEYVIFTNPYYTDMEGRELPSYMVEPLTPITQDASAVSGWNVPNGSQAFFDGESTTWENIPSWN